MAVSRAAVAAPTAFTDPLAELGRGLDVVGEDQEVLWLEGPLRAQEVRHALDDQPRLARAGAGDDHRRPLAPLDDAQLLSGERRRRCFSRRRSKHHRHASPGARFSQSSGAGEVTFW